MRLKQAILFAVILLLGAVNFTFAQMKISGKVKSKVTGEGLSGATIFLKGTTLNSVTDSKGDFTITTPEKGGTLTISYAGMKTVDIKVTSANKILEIILEETIGNEVVVVGYGTKKRKDLSTSVSSVSAKEINATPVADAAQALQGRVSGVTITQNSGAPGGTGPGGAGGAQGFAGPTGPGGATGGQGAQGPQGSGGPPGATGGTGAQGAQGAPSDKRLKDNITKLENVLSTTKIQLYFFAITETSFISVSFNVGLVGVSAQISFV
jgi:hypothetical protein